MTPLLTLQMKQADTRKRLSELVGLPDEKRSETYHDELSKLSREVAHLEEEIIAARLLEVEPETRKDKGEVNEIAKLRDRVGFGDYVQAAMSQRGADGAAKEYNEALEIPENRFPLSMFAPETRAAIDGDAGAHQGTWLDRLFDQTAASRLGITFTPVPAGIGAFPVMTSTAAAAQRARAQAADSGTFTATVTEMKPKRGVTEGIYSIEDDARLPGLGDAILRDLSAALVEGIDKMIFKGDSGASGTDADITGLQTASITEFTLTQANKVKGDETLKALVAYIDGKHASGIGDIRIVASEGANTLWYGTVHAAAVENQTVAQFLAANGVTWGVRGGIETATAAGDFGAYIGLARGIDGAARAAVWSAGELIRDPYTGAKKGEVSLTLNYLWDFGVPRTSNFKRLKFVA